MTPSSLMLLGLFVIVFALVIGSIDKGDGIVLAIAGGAIFGKGYGIWEERDGGR